MPVARCDEHGPPRDLKISYPHRHKVKLSDRCLFCGIVDCKKPADLWLTDAEQYAYRQGMRRFGRNEKHEVI